MDILREKVTPVTLNLITTLTGNTRLNEVPKIIGTFIKLMKAKRGEVEAITISANTPTKAQMDAVVTTIKG